MIGSAIGKFLRTITIGLDGLIYPLIPTVYNVFYDLASGKLFSNNTISTITGNLYILVSVAMLFAFGAQLIKAIINPDMLLDSKNGTVGFIKRMIIAVVLITAIPILFSNLEIVQKAVLDNSLIEKIILGINPNESNKNDKTASEKAGQYLAGATIGSSIYPKKDATSSKENLGDIYNEMIGSNINKIDELATYINDQYESNGEKKFVFSFQKLPSLVAGFVVLYMLLLACFDMALRLCKIAFLEVSAPVSIIAYVINGKTALDRWFKELMSTFAGVFVQIAALSFVVVGLTQIENLVTGSKSSGWLIRLFVICGLLMFIKLLPQLIQTLFGINIDSKGGIRGRLASMAAVGGIAANAWSRLTGATLGVAGGVAGLSGRAAIGAGKLAGRGAKSLAKGVGKGISTGASNFYNSNRVTNFRNGLSTRLSNAKNRVQGGRVATALGTAGTGIKNFAGNTANTIKNSKAVKMGASVANATGITSGFGSVLGDIKDTLKASPKNLKSQALRAGTVLKAGATSSGFAAGFKTANSTWKDNEYTRTQHAEAETRKLQRTRDRQEAERVKLQEKMGFNYDASKDEMTIKNIRRDQILDAVSKTINTSINGSGVQQATDKLTKINREQRLTNNVKDSLSTIISNLDSVASNTMDTALKNSLNNLSSQLTYGTINANDFKNRVQYLQNTHSDAFSSGTANKIIKDLDNTINVIKQNPDIITNGSKIYNENGQLSLEEANKASKKVDAKQEKAKQNYDAYYDIQSDSIKRTLDNIIDSSNKVDKQLIYESKQNGDSHFRDQAGPPRPPIRSNQDNTQESRNTNSSEQPQNQNSNPNSGRNSESAGQNLGGSTLNVNNINTNTINANTINSNNLNANKFDASKISNSNRGSKEKENQMQKIDSAQLNSLIEEISKIVKISNQQKLLLQELISKGLNPGDPEWNQGLRSGGIDPNAIAEAINRQIKYNNSKTSTDEYDEKLEDFYDEIFDKYYDNKD